MNGKGKIIIAITKRLAKDFGENFLSEIDADIIIINMESFLFKKGMINGLIKLLINNTFLDFVKLLKLNKLKNYIFKNKKLKSEVALSSALIIDWSVGNELTILMESMPLLRWIHVVKTGVDHIPVESVRQRNIYLTCVKGVYAQAVAEFTIGLIYYRFKKFCEHEEMKRQGRWSTLWSQGLAGRKLLVLGTGSIGKKIAFLAADNNLIVNGVNSDGRMVDGFVQVASSNCMVDLWLDADIVVNCFPLTPLTRGIIGNREFSLLKEGAIFINVGRDETVKADALLSWINASNSNWAALDIDKISKSHPYGYNPRIFLTHHSAYTSQKAKVDLADMTIDNVKSFLNGREISGKVDMDRGF